MVKDSFDCLQNYYGGNQYMPGAKPAAAYMQGHQTAGPGGGGGAPPGGGGGGMSTAGATFQSAAANSGSPIQQMKIAANSAGPPPNMTVGMNGNIGGGAGPPVNSMPPGNPTGVQMHPMQSMGPNSQMANQQFLQGRMTGDPRGVGVMYQQGAVQPAGPPNHFTPGNAGGGGTGAGAGNGATHYNNVMMMGGNGAQTQPAQPAPNDFSNQGNLPTSSL